MNASRFEEFRRQALINQLLVDGGSTIVSVQKDEHGNTVTHRRFEYGSIQRNRKPVDPRDRQ